VVALTLWLDLLMHKASLPVLLKVAKLMLLAQTRVLTEASHDSFLVALSLSFSNFLSSFPPFFLHCL
jgi:hypothetical protein